LSKVEGYDIRIKKRELRFLVDFSKSLKTYKKSDETFENIQKYSTARSQWVMLTFSTRKIKLN